ncbi:HPr-rel-A system PqqD family protein [Sphingomonas spermidinifaciens]|uniref:HPr-rel-A system PqqD family protein n=1 Tax=Sphingomonas spermidinifaciens TaxID=1141889 RepID=A0A2A4B657_9SPHN|nr:HPr-rel-A system PqqD family peptide chaperone [Sphingomonas spermidinifaciens]PCD03124.1 HPr-rel-A system PqqD family protein [Sphingomonas spermidinifaciens]
MRYRAADRASLRIVPLDVLTAIYHRASGQTHIVEAPVPEILAALGDDALDVGAILDRLARDYALIDPDPAALADRLEELAAAGLVIRT